MIRPARMQAAVLHGQRDVRIESVEVPRLEPGEVLLRTKVALTCGTDAKVYRRGYHARMIVPPALFGHEMAGVIEELGPGTEGWDVGTAVVAANSAPCGDCGPCRQGRPSICDDLLFWNGAYAEFACIPARIVEKNLLRLGAVPFRKGAMVEPLACVLRGLEGVPLGGRTVVVVGTGPIALMFVALASRRGARVVVAGRRETRLAKAASLGAAATVCTVGLEDPAPRIREETEGGRGGDLVIEAVGVGETCRLAVRLAAKGGTVNFFAGCAAGETVSIDAQALHYEEITITSTFHHTPEAFRSALRHIADGEIDPDALISGEAPLSRLPEILEGMGGGELLKTAILP